jgi:G3E family GTPase
MDWGKPGRPEFDRLIIETSGVASPEPILDTLLRDRWLSARCRLLAVVTTVSAATGEEQLDRFPEAQAQVAWADVLVVTQSDLAAPDFLARLEDLLDRLAAATPRIPAVHGDLDPASLLGQAAGFRRLPDARDLPEHRFRSVSVHLPAPMPWPVLAETLEGLLARHGDSLVRIKGVVHLPDAFEPVAVHAAGGRLYPPASLPVRLDDDALGRLVFITAGSAEQLAEDLASAGGGLFGAIRM